MGGISIDRAGTEAFAKPKAVLHRREGSGTGDPGQVCAVDVW
jgi:hypothetical protein